MQKVFKTNNALAKAKFKMKYYQMQREFEANPDKDVYEANQWIQATIADENLTGFYTEESIELLKEIQKEFQGKSSQEIHNSFSDEVKSALAELDAINDEIVPKALFTAGVIRGEQVTMFNHYTHHNVITDNAEALAAARKEAFTSPGATKAGVVNERLEGVKPISFDPFYDVATTGRGLLLDFHMTPVNRTVLRTVNRMEANIKKNGNTVQKQAAQALHSTVKEVLSNVFDTNYKEFSTGGALLQKIQKLSYQATLASAPRAIAELASNVAFVMGANPKDFTLGATKYAKYSKGVGGISILTNTNSGQTGKLYEAGISGSKHVEYSEAPGGRREQAQAKSEVRNKVGYILRKIRRQ